MVHPFFGWPSSYLLVVRRRVPLRSRGSIPVRLAPFEALGSQLVRREAARPRREATRDHDRLLPVPSLVVGHDSADGEGMDIGWVLFVAIDTSITGDHS